MALPVPSRIALAAVSFLLVRRFRCSGRRRPWHAANVVPVLDITHSTEWPGHVISSMSWNRMTPNQSLFSSRMTCSVSAATPRT